MMLRYVNSVSPTRYTPSPKRNFPPRVTPSPPRGGSQDRRSGEERSPSRSISPRGRPAGSRSPSLHKSDADVSSCSLVVSIYVHLTLHFRICLFNWMLLIL